MPKVMRGADLLQNSFSGPVPIKTSVICIFCMTYLLSHAHGRCPAQVKTAFVSLHRVRSLEPVGVSEVGDVDGAELFAAESTDDLHCSESVHARFQFSTQCAPYPPRSPCGVEEAFLDRAHPPSMSKPMLTGIDALRLCEYEKRHRTLDLIGPRGRPPMQRPADLEPREQPDPVTPMAPQGPSPYP